MNREIAFKRWFEGSKVVDAGGKPLVVYHGTNAEFNAFDLGKAGSNNDTGMWGTGFYFSPSQKMSRGYGIRLKALYISLKNPLVVKGVSHLPQEFKPAKETHGDAGLDASSSLRVRLITAGYDGVMHYEIGDKVKLSQVIAFYPEQIKSATGNCGTFDPTNPSIFA